MINKKSETGNLAVDQLRKTLSAGSSRVFDCGRLHLNAIKSGATPDQYMFLKPQLNNIIFIKEPFNDERMVEDAGRAVGTKLYFPYNERDSYEGGKSIFVNDWNIRSALQFHVGIPEGDSSDEIIRDFDLLQCLEELPSLDPFLLKDRLHAFGLNVHDDYLEISEAEFSEIRNFVMDRFRPMVELAFEDAGQADKLVHLRTLVLKIWEGKDMDSLSPLLQALQLSAEDAPEIFYAWKGVIYYDYLHAKQRDQWKQYAAFLRDDTVPTDSIQKDQREDLDAVLGIVRSLFKQRWKRIEKILSDYSSAYDALFKERKSPGPFISFLKESSNHFFSLGDCISCIDHAIEVKNSFNQSKHIKRMRYDKLYSLLGLTIGILK